MLGVTALLSLLSCLICRKKETHSAAQRSSAEGKDALEAFVGACLEQVSPPGTKHPSSAPNPALSTFVHLSLVKATADTKVIFSPVP